MTFAGAIQTCFKKFADFRGTATRPEFWYFTLFTVLVSIVLSTIDSVVWPAANGLTDLEMAARYSPLSDTASFVLFLPQLAVSVRRYRDAGFSAKWLLLWLAPIGLAFIAAGGAITYALNSNLQTWEALIAVLLMFAPALFVALGVQIFFFVLSLKPTKTFAEGNKHAAKPAAPDYSGTTA
jgi:uncharacterized membrane protein YhaH (DUF805 family)